MTFDKWPRRFPVGNARVLLVFGAVLVLGAEVSRALSLSTLSMSILWPPTGMILGAAVVMGWSPVLIAAPLITGWLVLSQGLGVVAAVIMTGAQLAGIVCGLMYLRRHHTGLDGALLKVSDRLVYLKSGVVTALVSAALGTFAMSLGGADLQGFLWYDIFLVYWLLEVLSILLFAPLAYFALANTLSFFRNAADDLRQPATALALGGLFAIAAGIAFMPASADQTYLLALSFLVFPVLCWLVLAAHPAVIVLALPLVAFLFVGYLTTGVGAVPQMADVEAVVRLLLLMTVSILLLQIIALVTFSRNQLVATLEQQANTDFLSGLKNDRAFLGVIAEQISGQTDEGQPEPGKGEANWLVYLEVLDFDHLEDLMGFRERRTLETLLSARLMGAAGPESMPARLGNGIYACLGLIESGRSIDALLHRFYAAFDGQQFKVGDHQTRIRISVGAVRLDGVLKDPNQYLSAATQASMMARDRLPRIHTIAEPESLALDRIGLTERLELLKNALSDERLVLFAQPIMALSDSNPGISYEILLRLKGDDGSFVSPGAFLPVAEAYGFMRQIDQWVIRSTFRALAANPDWLEKTRKCAINLAGVSLSSSEIVDTIEAAFEETGIPKTKIAFEITETQRISSRQEAEEITRKLRSMGCSVSLDDFGTGLATFDYLKSFEFDTLKIDGAFIRNIETSQEDKQIVRSICDVARWMGLKTVAEFVENQSVVDLLKELGVDYGQGFGLARPSPLEEIFSDKVEPGS
jgi:EAL domain-containing protein (putative c-di-GMP-specific phosphodiesterase class I)/GGDEF domain-containing protein